MALPICILWSPCMYRGLWLAEHILQQLSRSRCRHIMPTYVSIIICWYICRHLNMLASLSAFWNCVLTYMWANFPLLEEYVVISLYWIGLHLFNDDKRPQRHIQCVGIHVSILMCRHIGRHLDMSTYWPAQEQICWHMSTHLFFVLANMLTCPDADIYVDTSRCWHICQPIEMSAHSTSIEKHADIYVNTFFRVLGNMPTYSDADIYVDILICWHKCRKIEMPTYVGIFMSTCRLGSHIEPVSSKTEMDTDLCNFRYLVYYRFIEHKSKDILQKTGCE